MSTISMGDAVRDYKGYSGQDASGGHGGIRLDAHYNDLWKYIPLYADENMRLIHCTPDLGWVLNGSQPNGARAGADDGSAMIGDYEVRVDPTSGGVGTLVLSTLGRLQFSTDAGLASSTTTLLFNGGIGAGSAFAQEPYIPTAGTEIRFGCKFQYSDVDMNWVIGLSDSATAPIGSQAEGIQFHKIDGDENVKLLLTVGSSTTQYSLIDKDGASIIIAPSTYYDCGFVLQGAGASAQLHVFFNGRRGVLNAPITGLPTAGMCPSMSIQNGTAAATRNMTVERFHAAQDIVS